MPKNADFLRELNDYTSLAAKDLSLRNKALEDLLQADPGDATKFRKAITDNKDFWNTYRDKGLMDVPLTSNWIWSNTPIADYLISDIFLAPEEPSATFTQLRKVAAEQRVKLGLKDVAEDVLIEVLKNNTAECRAYLANKSLLGDTTKIHGWIPTPSVPAPVAPQANAALPQNSSVAVLTDGAITNIQLFARDIILSKHIKIVAEGKVDSLSGLLNPDVTQRKKAAKDLGIPPEAVHLQINATDSIKDVIDARVIELKQINAKTAFPKFVQDLPVNELLAYKSALEHVDIAEFQRKLPSPFQTDLATAYLKDAKSILGLRYLQTYLPTETKSLVPAINAPTEVELREELCAILSTTGGGYIDATVTSDRIGTIKKALVHGLIKQIPRIEDLTTLNRAKLLEFKTELQKLGRTSSLEWIKDDDLGEMKQWTRTRLFEAYIDKYSRLGSGAHSALITAYNKLPIAKQSELLEKPDNLRFILNAKDSKGITHYLGRGALGVTDVVKENKRLAIFRGIHNSEVARVLAGFEPAIQLDDVQVEQINKAFVTNVAPPVYDATLFTTSAQYASFINKIKDQCGVKREDLSRFYGAFNLNQEGSDFIDPCPVKDKIKQQHEFNKNLLNGLHNVPAYSEPIKKILVLLLGEEKESAIDVETDVKKIINVAETPQQKKLKNALNYLLEPLIRTLKINLKKADFKSSQPDKVDSALAEYNNTLIIYKKERQLLRNSAKKLEHLIAIEDVHLMNPAFQEKALSGSREMLKTFKNLAEQCDLIVNQLRGYEVTINEYLSGLPVGNQIQLQDKAEQIRELKIDMKQELVAINKDLEFYETIQAKLYGEKSPDGKKENDKMGVLEVIENAANGKKNYFYEIEGITSDTFNISKIPETRLSIKTKNSAPLSTAEINQAKIGETLPFLLDDKLNEGEVRVYDYNANINSRSYYGRFTEEHLKTNSVKPSGKFQVKEFPSGGDAEQLALARVKFSLAMAIQCLSTMDSPPTKKNPLILRGTDSEQLQYLYSALIKLGVDKKAIMVKSSSFNPELVKGLFGGFKDAFKVMKIFNNTDSQSEVKASKQHLEQILDIKKDKSGTRKKVGAEVENVTQLFKTKNLDFIEKAKEVIEKEGPVSKPPGKR